MPKRSLALGPAGLILLYGLWTGPRYGRYVLPAFDGFVYDAMADNPRVFTLAPWGYRILAPWIVHLLPTASAAEGYFWLTLICLAAAVAVLDSWLRRLGFTPKASALACAAFSLSPPVRLMLDYQVLVDPLALLIVAMLLRELSAPRLPILMALLAAGALTKEACLVPAFMVPVVLIERYGAARGWAQTLAALVPAAGLALLLRLTWGEAGSSLDFALPATVAERLQQSAPALGSAAALSGAAFLAFAGLFRERSLALRVQWVGTWALTFLSVLANPYHFSVVDLPRLSAFAWPALLPLALSGLGFTRTAAEPRSSLSSRAATILCVLVLSGCMALVGITDSFSHQPENAAESPIRYLARNRETLKTAAMLEEGGALTFDSRSGRYAGPITERFNLTEGRQHRWFLFDGFGPEAVFESGDPEFRGEAHLLLPLLVPRPVSVTVTVEGPADARISVAAGGRDLGVIAAGVPASFRVPASTLIRGVNVLVLKGASDQSLRLRRFEARLDF